jgi:hypothetical protein
VNPDALGIADRLGDSRQGQLERIGQHSQHALEQRLERRQRPDPQSVRPRPHALRLEFGFAAALESASLKGRRLGIVRRIGSDDGRGRPKRPAGAEGIDAALRKHRLDALVALTLSPAWPIDLVNGENFSNVFWITTPAAVAGYPHATVPAGFVYELPVGMSFFASAWHDAEVLALAHAFEQAHQARRVPQYLATVPTE